MSYDLDPRSTASCTECKQPFTPTWTHDKGICSKCTKESEKSKELFFIDEAHSYPTKEKK